MTREKWVFFERGERGVDVGPNGGFFIKLRPREKACQTYGRLQIQISIVVEWRLIFEIMQLSSKFKVQGSKLGRLRVAQCGSVGWRGVPPHPNPMASQARHKSVSPQESNASRFVVPPMGAREKKTAGLGK